MRVYDSDIICELLKSGYKFEELKRANKGTYNAGMKKYEKWKENGSPEDEDADALEQYAESESHCPENDTAEQAEEEKQEYDYPATDEAEPEEADEGEDLIETQNRTIAELKYKNAKLEVKNESLMSENMELKADNSKYEKDIEIQNGRINYLERQLIGSQAYDDVCEKNKQLMERIDELEADNQIIRKQLAELNQSYAEAMTLNDKIKQNAEIDNADLETAHRMLADEYRKNDELTKKLEIAERCILNKIYADYEKEKDTNAG